MLLNRLYMGFTVHRNVLFFFFVVVLFFLNHTEF